MPEQQKLEKWKISVQGKKMVRIVLYWPAISQSDYRKTGPYPLPSTVVEFFLFWK